MTKGEVEIIITDTVAELQGCKATTLIAKLGKEHPELFTSGLDIIAIVEELAKKHRLREVEYILPGLSYKVKSFFLPAETEIYLP